MEIAMMADATMATKEADIANKAEIPGNAATNKEALDAWPMRP
jgi:hypothetical protein